MLKYSRQREAIRTFLAGRYDHPTAETVYLGIKEEFPNISLGTVYRNLTMLADSGVILRLTEHDKDHFDGDISPHMHFYCEKCGKIYDVFSAFPSDIAKKAEHEIGCEIESIDVSIHGTCAECAKNQK